MNAALLERWFAIRSTPAHVIVLAAVASYAAQALAALQGWPFWGIVLATLLPWIPVFSLEMVWTYRHYGWLALYYVLVVTQVGHFMEHVVQIYQIHVQGLRGADASGVFGALDVEWVHFIWNTWIIIAVSLLLWRYRGNRWMRNPWLWITLVIAGWHEVEHAYIMSVYLSTGVERTPGLLSRGGAIGGGLPLARPDLHFYYNLIETAPLVIGFVYQLTRTYNEWLAKALPHASQELLTETTNQLETLEFAAGDMILRQGDPADRFYIVARGEVVVTRRDPAGQEVQVATLGSGQYFGEIGLLSHMPRTASVWAKTDVEVLALDQDEFRWLVSSSEATEDDLERVARQRLARA